MPTTRPKSSAPVAFRRSVVVSPTSSTTSNTGSANRRKAGPKSVAWATSASATMAAESTVRNMPARVKISFQVIERVASRLQCSVARICTRTASVTPERSESGGRGNDGSGMAVSFGWRDAAGVACRSTIRHQGTRDRSIGRSTACAARQLARCSSHCRSPPDRTLLSLPRRGPPTSTHTGPLQGNFRCGLRHR